MRGIFVAKPQPLLHRQNLAMQIERLPITVELHQEIISALKTIAIEILLAKRGWVQLPPQARQRVHLKLDMAMGNNVKIMKLALVRSFGPVKLTPPAA